MSIIFRYSHIQREDGSLRKAPYIPIYAKTSSGRLMKLPALIDSGADFTVLTKDLADLMGLKLGEKSETAGIGGGVNVRKARFFFQIKGTHEKYSFNVPALVLLDDEADVPILLGRHGFFEEFHITFRQNEEKIVLKKIQPSVDY